MYQSAPFSFNSSTSIMTNFDMHDEDYSLTLSDDDSCSSSGDSGISIDKTNEPVIIIAPEEPSFLSRFASIPIIQDSFSGVRKHAVGQKALDIAETMFSSARSYLPQNAMTSQANRIGNKSLDLIESRFPIITSPTVEILDTYLPEQEDGKNRLMQAINTLSNHTAKTISEKIAATVEEERQLKQMIFAWITEQAQLQQWESFTQTEIEKFRQELFKPNISHMERIRNILALSQTDILLPLYQKIWNQEQATATD